MICRCEPEPKVRSLTCPKFRTVEPPMTKILRSSCPPLPLGVKLNRELCISLSF